MKFDEFEIKKTFLSFQEEGEQEACYCFGITRTKNNQTSLLGDLQNFAGVDSKYSNYGVPSLIGFTNKKLIFTEVKTIIKNKINTAIVNYNDIKTVRITDRLFGIQKAIYIELHNETIINLKLSKIVKGLKVQEMNLKSLCHILENKF